MCSTSWSPPIAQGIVHRAIEPDSLFVTTGGHVRVLDFGIARRFDADVSSSMTGRMIGSSSVRRSLRWMSEPVSVDAGDQAAAFIDGVRRQLAQQDVTS